MNSNENSLNWFEISVADINRAKKFYETIFSIKMKDADMMGMKMAFFPNSPGTGKANGGLVQGQYHKPSVDGVKVYLNSNPDLSVALSKVEKAGGKITLPKTSIGDDMGHMAFFMDTEGNIVALHSNN